MADDLVGSGLVGSMAQPEGNMTGVAIFAFQLDLKRLELLHEVVPNAARIGILADPDQIRRPDALDRAARDLGIEIVQFTAKSNEEIINATDAMKAKSTMPSMCWCQQGLRACHRLTRPPHFAKATNLSVSHGE
jgi:putative ABC transport system substrate-binding protein